jgi:hypothetical protein
MKITLPSYCEATLYIPSQNNENRGYVIIISNTMIFWKLVIKFPESRGRFVEFPKAQPEGIPQASGG